MKFNISLLTICLIASAYIASAQCNPYFLLEEGRSWEISTYNAKGKFQGKQTHEIKSVREIRDGIEATIALETFDKKGKSEYEKDVNIECVDGAIKMDMTTYFPPEMMDSFYSSGAVIETENVEVPSSLTVGQGLADGSIKFTMGGAINMTVELVNRKVAAKEKVEVPAGTFECYKITYTIRTKAMMTMEMTAAEWITEGVGPVKSEQYDKKGNLKGYSELSNYSK